MSGCFLCNEPPFHEIREEGRDIGRGPVRVDPVAVGHAADQVGHPRGPFYHLPEAGPRLVQTERTGIPRPEEQDLPVEDPVDAPFFPDDLVIRSYQDVRFHGDPWIG